MKTSIVTKANQWLHGDGESGKEGLQRGMRELLE